MGMTAGLKSGVAAAALLFAAGLGAHAADSAPAYKARPAAVTAPFSWTGFYLGGNAGYGWANGGLRGVLGGGQLGYNWQTGNFVLGIETDFQTSGQRASNSVTTLGATFAETDKVTWFGTTRARAGFAQGPWLFYGTGGIAYGQVKIDGTATGTVVGPYSASGTKTGWTVGAGIENAIDKNWSWKLEYLYVSVPGFTNTYTTLTPNVAISYGAVHDNIVRVGFNYSFR
jgi:outer membrane immunogenic protein